MRETILSVEREFEAFLVQAQDGRGHLPSRVRSLIWILCALRPMAEQGFPIADEGAVRRELAARLPGMRSELAQTGVATA